MFLLVVGKGILIRRMKDLLPLEVVHSLVRLTKVETSALSPASVESLVFQFCVEGLADLAQLGLNWTLLQHRNQS